MIYLKKFYTIIPSAATRHGLLDERCRKNVANFEPDWIFAHAIGVLFFRCQLTSVDGLQHHETVQTSRGRCWRTTGNLYIYIIIISGIYKV